jgi:hypothetical protein
MWLITKYKCDENGKPYGDAFQTPCYTQDLMEAYRGRHFVEKIDEVVGNGQLKTVWSR